MGFWDTLKNTAGEIGNWALNNSGTIINTVGTIAKVAGILAMTEEDYAKGEPLLPHLTTVINGAQKNLLKASEAESPTPTESDGWKVKNIDFPCFWPLPTAHENATPIPEIGMDINRLLAMHDVPNTLGKDGTDAGMLIAQQFFNSFTAKTLDSEKGIKSNGLKIDLGPTAKLTGCMTYYEVPLGNPEHTGWHSHMRVNYHYTSEAESLYQAQKRSRAIRPAAAAMSVPYNAANVVVAWTGSQGVADLMTRAVQDLVDNNKDRIEFNTGSVDGTRFTYQFKSVTTIGPAEVASKLAHTISDELGRLGGPTPAPTPTMPTIKVTNLQAILA